MSKNIYILCPVHRRADLIEQQLLSYYSGCPTAKHILHPSIESRKTALIHSLSDSEIISDINFCFTQASSGTSYKCVMGAFLECSKVLNNKSDGFVYIHTDGDLFIKGNLTKHIEQITLASSVRRIHKDWWHYEKMISDQSFLAFLEGENINKNQIMFGRQEGAFFPLHIWNEITNIVNKYYDKSFFNQTDLHWPIEEVIIPTLLNHLGYKPIAENIVKIKKLNPSKKSQKNLRDLQENNISIKELHEYLRLEDDCIAAKWFSQNALDPARMSVSILGLNKSYWSFLNKTKRKFLLLFNSKKINSSN